MTNLLIDNAHLVKACGHKLVLVRVPETVSKYTPLQRLDVLRAPVDDLVNRGVVDPWHRNGSADWVSSNAPTTFIGRIYGIQPMLR